MEQNEFLSPGQSHLQQESQFLLDLSITPSVEYSLLQICKWASLLVYISAGLLLLGCVWLFAAWNILKVLFFGGLTTGPGIVGVVVVIVAICVLVWAGFLGLLLNCSIKVKAGLAQQNIHKVQQGAASLKAYFIASGILGILATILYLSTFFKTL